MCDACSSGLKRREFMAAGALSTAAALTSPTSAETTSQMDTKLAKKSARIQVVFLYPPLDIVNAGKLEDQWAKHHWSTWPGNQFQPEKQQEKFTRQIRSIAKKVGVEVNVVPKPVYTSADIGRFIANVNKTKPDALLVVNFWNTFSQWAYQITQEVGVPAIVYHSVGSNHQLPPQNLMNLPGVYYIHSIENWEEIERAIRAVHAKKMLSQSRLLRVGNYTKAEDQGEGLLGVHITQIPAGEYNALFDSVAVDENLRREAAAYRRQATQVMDVTDHFICEAFRAHHALARLRERYGGDAVTIKCLMLKERKPCISFSINNGDLVPCGCENDYHATLTLMLGRWLLDRGGFQHNPEFDTSRNQYFGAHCTCPTKLLGPDGPSEKYWIRPFFHQLPKTAALDVQWTPEAPVFLAKYTPEKLYVWTGMLISSPACPPTGGCATRALVKFDGVQDVCSVYPGPHPILYRGTPEEAKRLKAFAQLYRIPLKGNI